LTFWHWLTRFPGMPAVKQSLYVLYFICNVEFWCVGTVLAYLCMLFQVDQYPIVGSRVERIDPLRFLAGCRKGQLNQPPSVLSLSLGFFWYIHVLCCYLGTLFRLCYFYVICVLLLGCSCWVVSTSATDWQEWLISEMTYNMLIGTLNPTRSLRVDSRCVYVRLYVMMMQGNDQCDACHHVQDGPYCEAECPDSHYPDHSRRCRPCHENCLGGCTGPANMPGPGGCNACGVVVYDEPDSSYCLSPDTECPPDFYKTIARVNWTGVRYVGVRRTWFL